MRPDRNTKRKLTGAKRLARQYEHLWPDKPGQSKEQKIDSLRHSLTDHVSHIGEMVENVREDEKEHVKTLSDMANEYLCEFYDNMMKAKGAAKTSQEFMYASNAGAPGAMLLSKLNVSDGKSANQVTESSLITSLSSKVPEAFDVQMGNSEQKATPDTNMVDEK